MEEPKKTVLILHETLTESIISDTVSFIMLTLLVGVGVYVFESEAMQWIAGILWFVWMLTRGGSLASRNKKTPQQAVDFLYEKYGAITKGTK